MQMDEPPSFFSSIMRCCATKRPLVSEIRSFKDKVILQATKTFDYSNRAPSFGCMVRDRGKSETTSVTFSDGSPPSYNDVAPRDASPPYESSSVHQNLAAEEIFEEARSTSLNFGEIYGIEDDEIGENNGEVPSESRGIEDDEIGENNGEVPSESRGIEDDEIGENNGEVPSESRSSPRLLAFSGSFTSNQVREILDTEMEHDNSSDTDELSTIYEESGRFSIEEVIKSTVFSEDESSEDSLWIDLDQDPLPLGFNSD